MRKPQMGGVIRTVRRGKQWWLMLVMLAIAVCFIPLANSLASNNRAMAAGGDTTLADTVRGGRAYEDGKIDWTKIVDTSKIPSTVDRATTSIQWKISYYTPTSGTKVYPNYSRDTATDAGTVTLKAGSDTLEWTMPSACKDITECDMMEGGVYYNVDVAIGTRGAGAHEYSWDPEATESSPVEVPVEVFVPNQYTMDKVLTVGDEAKLSDNLGTVKWQTYDGCTADGQLPSYLVEDDKTTTTPTPADASRCEKALENNLLTEKPEVKLQAWFIKGSDPADDENGINNTGDLGVTSAYHPTEVTNFATGITLTYPKNGPSESMQNYSYSQGEGHDDSLLKYVPSTPRNMGPNSELNDAVITQCAGYVLSEGRYALAEAQKANKIYGSVTMPKTVEEGPHNPEIVFTIYVNQPTEPCDLAGTRIPADTTTDPDNGCIALIDGIVQNGAAYEDAVIGGGDDGTGTEGYSSLINESAANILAQKNKKADITYTFKDSDGNKLGEFTTPAGSTKKSQGSWKWEDGAKKYLQGAGAHKMSVELTSSTHAKDENGKPVVLKTWNFTMDVYVPAMDVADSDIIKGDDAPLSANMLPGSVLSEKIGASGSLAEPNEVYWTKDHVTKAEADYDIAEEKSMLTSKPTATPYARFLEGDKSVGLEMGSNSEVRPSTTTTFQVKFKLSGSTYSQAAETSASGLTDDVTNSTDLYLWNQHNEYVGGNNSSMIGAPLDSAANSLKPDPAKGAFTIYVAPTACYAGGSIMPSTDASTGCLGLNDGAVQNGAAHEFAVIGGGDDGTGGKGYSGLIRSDFAAVFLKDNTDSAVTWTVKDADGNALGTFTVPAGSKSTAAGAWKWASGAQEYLKGIGSHKLTVELTVSGHDKDANGNPVVLKTWHPTVTVYVPAMDVADSDIIKGHKNPMSANMLPGSVLSEVIGASGSLTEPNEVYWTKDHVIKAEADNDLAAEKTMLTSAPTVTPTAVVLAGDSLTQSEYQSSWDVAPAKTTTFQVKFELRGSSYPQGDEKVETVKSGLTSASDMVNGVTQSYLWNQHNEYVGGNNSSMIGAPLDSAANSLKPDATKGAFTIYVGYAPCDLSGSHVPSTDANTGCVGLIDAAVQDGAAHEYAIIGGGDDGKAGNGYSGLIYSATTKILLQENPDATITYTVKNTDGDELGHYAIPAGSKSVDDGKWAWKDGAQEYLKGVGAHQLSVELTASTHDLDANGDPVVLRTWTPKVTVYIPAVHLNDSDIKLGSDNPLKNNMLPGGVLSENTGFGGNPSEPNEVYWEKKAMGEKASGDNDLAAERHVLTSAPTATPVAMFLEGDDKVGSGLESDDTVSPTTSTTFQVKFDLSGSTSGAVETTPTGLTGDFTEGKTEQALYSQVSEYQLNTPNGAFGEFLGVPLETAENPLSPDQAKAAFTIYVSGKTVSSLPLTGGTGAGLAAVLTGLGTLLFAGLLAGMAWWTRKSRSAAHALNRGV
ncbi:MAG: hypothetical protein LKJ05_06520 [Bifidobacteriaceae bacterium]|nr:hypothetical protein [Bifidobacteriaceae bacterium]MCI1936236.1 hypothetical protein [Bifidobacteriaceae bacterium]